MADATKNEPQVETPPAPAQKYRVLHETIGGMMAGEYKVFSAGEVHDEAEFGLALERLRDLRAIEPIIVADNGQVFIPDFNQSGL